MILEIKRVRECREGEYGYFTIRSARRAYIAISDKRNRTVNQYAETLLHELLHFYTALLMAEGFKVSDRREHQWIRDCEDRIVRLMKKHIGRK